MTESDGRSGGPGALATLLRTGRYRPRGMPGGAAAARDVSVARPLIPMGFRLFTLLSIFPSDLITSS